MSFGKRLAEERRRLGLSQEQLAVHLGIGRSALGMIETDRSGLEAQRLSELGAQTGLDVIYVLTGRRAKVAAVDLLDWQLAEGILQGLERWAVRRRIELTPEKTARALRILYRHLSVEGVVDDARIAETMDLAA